MSYHKLKFEFERAKAKEAEKTRQAQQANQSHRAQNSSEHKSSTPSQDFKKSTSETFADILSKAFSVEINEGFENIALEELKENKHSLEAHFRRINLAEENLASEGGFTRFFQNVPARYLVGKKLEEKLYADFLNLMNKIELESKFGTIPFSRYDKDRIEGLLRSFIKISLNNLLDANGLIQSKILNTLRFNDKKIIPEEIISQVTQPEIIQDIIRSYINTLFQSFYIHHTKELNPPDPTSAEWLSDKENNLKEKKPTLAKIHSVNDNNYLKIIAVQKFFKQQLNKLLPQILYTENLFKAASPLNKEKIQKVLEDYKKDISPWWRVTKQSLASTALIEELRALINKKLDKKSEKVSITENVDQKSTNNSITENFDQTYANHLITEYLANKENRDKRLWKILKAAYASAPQHPQAKEVNIKEEKPSFRL